MEFDGIVIISAESGVPLFSKLNNIEETLFSGFLTAIRTFTESMSLGSLSSFTTDEKTVYLVARNVIIVAIICPADVKYQEIYNFGIQVGKLFESKYDLESFSSSMEVSKFDNFENHLSEITEEIPFSVRVAEFANKEFMGKVSVDVTLTTNEKTKTQMDLIIDNGNKTGGSPREIGFRHMLHAFSHDVSFVKIIDGTAGQGEVVEFFESMRSFGARKVDSDDPVFPYFPAKSIIIAKDYSPTVFEALENFEKFRGKRVISPTHIAHIMRSPTAPSSAKCFIELWQWHDDKYPERVLQ